MYKVKANLVPSYISDLFSCDTSKYNLRNTDDFSLPRCNTVTYGRHSLGYMGPYIWSKLHKSVKMADFLTAFKNQVSALDLSNVMWKNNCKNCKLCKTQFLSFLHCLYIVFFFLLLLLAQFNQFLLVKIRTIDTLIKVFIHSFIHIELKVVLLYLTVTTSRLGSHNLPHGSLKFQTVFVPRMSRNLLRLITTYIKTC